MIKSPSREPKVIGRYDLVEKIGSGGMGSVFRGRDRETDRAVAVKVLTSAVSANERTLQRFAQEFQAASKLDHPNIVRSLDFGSANGRAFLAMELIEGESLGRMIERDGPLSEDAAIRIITQVAQALHYAHRRRDRPPRREAGQRAAALRRAG